MRNKLNKIYYLSFFLAFLVVVRHSVNIEIYSITSGFLFLFQTWIRELTDIAVPAFFAVSGFLFYRSYNVTLLSKKLKSRFFSLVIPYLFWNLLTYLIYVLLSLIPFISSNINQSIEPLTLSNLIMNVVLGSYNKPTWFIRYLLVYTIIFPVFYPVIKNKKVGMGCIIFLYAISLFFDFGEHGYIRSSIFYLVGAYLGCNYNDLVEGKKNWKLSSVLFILISTISLLFVPQLLYNLIYVPIRIIQIFALWYAGDCFKDEEPCWWLKISFVIFCSHSLLLESIEKVFLVVFGKTTIGACIDLIFAPLLTIAIIILMSALFKQCKPIWRIMNGNR